MPLSGGRVKMPHIKQAIILVLATALAGGIFADSPLGLRLEEEVGLAWLFHLRGPVVAPSEVLIVRMDRESASRLGQSAKISDWGPPPACQTHRHTGGPGRCRYCVRRILP